MARPRKGYTSRRTEFYGETPVKTVNKYGGRCVKCGRDVKAGDGFAYRAPGAPKWSTTCGKYGCVDRSYHGAEEDPADRESRLDHEEQLDKQRREANPPQFTDEDLWMEHGHGR